MKHLLLSAFVGLLCLSACKKQNTKAEFSVLKSSFYLTEAVSFSNQSSNGQSYTWNFGDGQTSTETSPTHTYTAAGTYEVKLTTGSSSFVKKIKVNTGTASYEVNNQTALAIPMVSFRVDAQNELQDYIDHGTVAVNGKSDTTYTSSSQIYLAGSVGSSVFIVAQPYTITKFMHNKLPLTNNTQIVITQSVKTGVAALQKQTTTLKALKTLANTAE